MKLNKLNIAIVGLSGMMSAPAFAQNFYQCMPKKCQKGEYGAQGNCQKCPAGEYSDTINATACKKCPSGLVSEVGSEKCQLCPAGFKCDSNGFTACEWGTYSPSGDKSCTKCSREERVHSGASNTTPEALVVATIKANSTPIKCPTNSCGSSASMSYGGDGYYNGNVWDVSQFYYSTEHEGSPNRDAPYFGISCNTLGETAFLMFTTDTPWKTVSKDSGGKWKSEVSQYKSDIYHYLVVETNDTVKVYKANYRRMTYNSGTFWTVQKY